MNGACRLHHSSLPVGGKPPEPDAVVHAADEAMYAAKRGGKDRHTVVDI